MGILDSINPATRLRIRAEKRAIDYLDSHIDPFAKEFLGMFGVTASKMIRKDPRTILPGLTPSAPARNFGQIIDPPYDAERLQEVYERHWAVRTCIDKLVREVTRKGGHFEPMFETKCMDCGAEYDYVPISETCPTCAKAATKATTMAKATEGTAVEPHGPANLAGPDPSQTEEVKKFLQHPNPTLSTADLLKRFAKDLLIFDDAYISETFSTSASVPREWWPEDARLLAMVADVKGRLGGLRFCLKEETTKAPGTETHLYNDPAGAPCPRKDGGVLQEIGYVQRVGGNVVAALGPEEVMHTNLFAVGSRLFGTPKLWALQTQVTAMALIDAYQRESFDKSKTPNSIYLLKGVAEDAMRRLLKQHKMEKKNDLAADFWIPVPNYVSGKADVDIVKIPGMETPLLSGAMGYSDWYFKAICYTFGVDPASVGVETVGRLGSAQGDVIAKGVSPETINDIQIQVSEAWDTFIKKRWPKITDWKWTLETAHESEEKGDWETKKLQMETAKVAAEAGFDVIIDEDGTPKISGRIDQEQRRQDQADEMKARFGQTQASAAGESKPFAKAVPLEIRALVNAKLKLQMKDRGETVEQALENLDPVKIAIEIGASPDLIRKAIRELKDGMGLAMELLLAITKRGPPPSHVEKVGQKIGKSKAVTKQEPEDSAHGLLIEQGQKEYKAALDALAQQLFAALGADIDDVFGYEPSRSETVSMELAEAVIDRTKRVLDMALPQAEKMAIDQARTMYRAGQKLALSDIQKQDPNLVIDATLDDPDQAALELLAAASIESMRNTLFVGDQDAYLTRVREIVRTAAEENWTTSRLADELKNQLDPKGAYFSDYMWERIARTDPAIYITAGRLRSYGDFGIPKVKRLVASDADDDLCAPFADQVYDLAEADGVLPAHPNCRCAWSPYFGD